MSKISLNPQNRSYPPARDDQSIVLSDIEFFLAKDPHPQFRLTTATARQLIEAGIILKKGWQGLRLTHFYVELRSQIRERNFGYKIEFRPERWRELESAALVFQMPAHEVAELNAAPFDILQSVWHRLTEKAEYIPAMNWPEVAVDGLHWQ